jgi:hypothetical protein
MQYCNVVGNIIGQPRDIPTSYGNVSNFHVASQVIKNANGWFEYVPVIQPKYNKYTQELARSYIQVGNTIKDLWVINDIGQDDLNRRCIKAKSDQFQKIANKRWIKESSGYEYKSHIFKTDEYSQTKIMAAYIIAKDEQAYTVNWKTDNGYISLTSQDIINLFISIKNYIQSLFEKEAVFRSEVLSLNDYDLKAIMEYEFDFDELNPAIVDTQTNI